MTTRRRFFKKTKTEGVAEKEKQAVEKLQKGKVEFKKIERTSKKKEETKKRPHFPSISRSIPEVSTSHSASLSKKYTSGVYLGIGILIVLGVIWNIWVGVGLYKSFTSWWQVAVVREQLYAQMTTWENIAQKYPNYRDAYVEGEILAYRLGDRQKEQYFLNNLELLDPNFPITKSLEQLVSLQNQLGN